MLLILMDIHENILSAQCTIIYSPLKSNDDFDVLLKTDCLFLSLCKESNLYHNLKLPDGLFNPSSISSTCGSNMTIIKEENSIKLKVPFTETKEHIFRIDFRLQICDESILPKYTLRDSLNINLKDFMKNRCKTSEMYKILCAGCEISLNENPISFQAIKEFHEGASELAETWFCHKHDNYEQEIRQPNSDSLYIGDMYFYLHMSVIKCLNLTDVKREYKCSKCFTVLSLKKNMSNSSHFGFFCDKIMFQPQDDEICNIEFYKKDIGVLALYNIIEETVQSATSCKIYLQNKVGENTECLLLWINSQKVLQFLLCIENNSDIPKETDFQLRTVYKLLYSDCASDSELSKQWKHNFNVEFFQISDNMMIIIKELLDKSSQYISNGQELINGFKFGYLSLNPPVS